MLTTLRAHAGGCVACGVLAIAVVAACSGYAGQTLPRVPDCRVELLQTNPGSGYVEVGQISFEAYVAGPSRHQYTSPRALLAEIRPDVCAVGGDTLMVERNAGNVIVRATVFRRATLEDVVPPPPATPARSRSERCEPSCSAGFACEGGTCVQQCVPACADSETCGADQLCHTGSVSDPQ